MPRSSAAASVSTTIGAATATLVVVAAIFAWPTLSQCSNDPGGFGACLRGSLADGGLLESDGAPETPVPGPVAPPPEPAGWLDARAAELVPERIAAVELVAGPAGELSGEGAAPVLPVSPILLAPTAKVEATMAALGEAPTAMVRLSDDPGTMKVTAPAMDDVPPGRVALVGPVGAITATVVPPPVATEGPTRLLAPRAGGSLSVEVSTAAITAEPVPLEPLPVPPPLPVIPVEAAPLAVGLTAQITPEPVAVPVVRPEPPVAPVAEGPALRFNPAYPNVVILPPPATGANSSIQSWTID